jgi:hypothetical protein
MGSCKTHQGITLVLEELFRKEKLNSDVVWCASGNSHRVGHIFDWPTDVIEAIELRGLITNFLRGLTLKPEVI